ncbi:MAG: 4Fe-4S dicluster domain-containing protein [Pirellulaceae bacterium]
MTKQSRPIRGSEPAVAEYPRDMPSESQSLAASRTMLLSVDRRKFLETSGFAMFLAALAGCSRAPVRHVLSSPSAEVDATIGLARHFASTCGGCPAACGALVKSFDSRPIKIEGNREHPLSQGGLCAVGQAEVLGLYDSHRLRDPQLNGQPTDWQQVDGRVRQEVAASHQAGRSVCLLTGTVHSPTTQTAIQRFLAGVPGSRHVVYDSLSTSAIAAAHQQTHGVRFVPRYRFERADVIVALGADFLGTWISPVEYTAGYRAGRVPCQSPAQMSYHLQIESRMSLTGCNADQRWVVPPDALGAIAGKLAVELAGRAQRKLAGIPPAGPIDDARIKALADRLWAARGKTFVVCDSQDTPTQVVCNFINEMLGAYGQTLDIAAASQQRAGDDQSLAELLAELEAGQVGVMVIAGVNPIYDLPDGEHLGALLRGDAAPFVLRLGQHLDETTQVAACICPESHWLESWSDAEPVAGVVSLSQPTIAPLGSTRTLLECLLTWTPAASPASAAVPAAQAAIRDHWAQYIFPSRTQYEWDASTFWDDALRQGAVELQRSYGAPPAFDERAVQLAALPVPTTDDSLALVLYPKIGMLDGRMAHNPWLHELPDPVTKATWDNYLCLSPSTAQRLGFGQGDVARVSTNETAIELPVLIQPGQHDRVVAVALGYGRQGTDRFARVGPQWIEARTSVGPNGLIGVNAAPLLRWATGARHYARGDIRLEATGNQRRLATTQQHHSLSVPTHLATPGTERRPIVETTTLSAYRKDPHAGATQHHEFSGELWPDDHLYSGYRWGMVIDLNKCTGCSACVIACQAENNVPVVGRDEVLRSREMHWMRIDRYFDDTADSTTAMHQPMLCQHCGHAPCENVCPVLATVHSEEGLNQQVYNRCVGTRYCANNCPYKVRRFNWFEYSHAGRLENAALNPDITVRSRGVMEKCSFCVQRIREATLLARHRDERVVEGEIQTACQQSCPAAAIVFGDMNDPTSHVAQAMASARHYQVLSELNVRPSVGYLRMVRNREEQAQETHHV